MRLPWRRSSEPKTRDVLDDYLARLIDQQRAEIDGALILRREIVRRSLEEPDEMIDEELVDRCSRESAQLLDRLELLNIAEKL